MTCTGHSYTPSYRQQGLGIGWSAISVIIEPMKSSGVEMGACWRLSCLLSCRLAVIGLTDQQLHQRVSEQRYMKAAHVFEMMVSWRSHPPCAALEAPHMLVK